MKINLIAIGKTDSTPLQQLIDQYTSRLNHYVSFETLIIPNLKHSKNLPIEQQKKAEAALLGKYLTMPLSLSYLLDDKGHTFTSLGFAEHLQKELNKGLKDLNFIIGGPYGFSDEVYRQVPENMRLSLSSMTFSHQMIRLFFIEQLYRSFTILGNENYHHE